MEAGRVEIFAGIENRQLIENPTITKRSNRTMRTKMERNWNTAFSSPTEHPIDRRTFLPTAALELR
jgi:hypothetical protein